MTAPLAVLRAPRPARRAHQTYAKPGCFCSRCVKHRRAEPRPPLALDRADLLALIALYEARLATFRRELAEISK